MKSLIPNMLTAFNLVLGFFAILAAVSGDFFSAALLVFAAMVADGMDGRVARMFGVSSEFGKELDSLCDLVSFGVAPALMAYLFMLKQFGFLGACIAVAFATGGALRLARFNVNTATVKGYFMGLPIPAAGCVVATFIMLDIRPEGMVFPVMVAVFAYLMVSTVRYPDFKGKGEPIRIIPAVLAVVLAVYLLISFKNSYLFAPFFSFAIFGILNTVFGLFDSKTAK